MWSQRHPYTETPVYKDTCIQRHLYTKTPCLFAEPDLTFKKAFELAQAAEAADRDAKDIQLPPQHQPLHNIQKSPLTKLPSNSPHTCYRCGGAHASDACRFKDAECHYCHKRRHLVKVCRSRKKQHGK